MIRGSFAFLLAVGLLGSGCSDGTGPGHGDPTGNRIAFLAEGNAASMREDGSNQVLLTERPSGSRPIVTATGRSAALPWTEPDSPI